MFTPAVKYLFFFLVLFSHFISSNAQDKSKIDSLLRLIHSSVDTTSIDAQIELALEYMHADRYDSAMSIAVRNRDRAEKSKMKRRMMTAYNTVGLIFKNRGDLAQSIPEYTKALKLAEELGDRNKEGFILTNIGNIYGSLQMEAQAIPFHLRSLEIKKAMKDSLGTAKVYNNLGLNYERMGKLDKAMEYYLQSMNIKKQLKETLSLANSYSNISNIYRKEKLFEDALRFEKMSFEIREKYKNKKGIMISTFNLGLIHLDLKQYPETEKYFLRTLSLGRETGSVEDIKQACAGLAELYERTGHLEKAYNYMKEYSTLRDSIFKDEFAKAITEMNAKYEAEKKDKELLKKDVEIERQNANAKQEAFIRNIILGCLGFVVILAIIIFNGYRNKQKANKIISEQKKEVELQKEIVELQKEIVEEKNKDITDSINYASRIQRSLLPTEKYIWNQLKRLNKK